jgi:hypothetical protein
MQHDVGENRSMHASFFNPRKSYHDSEPARLIRERLEASNGRKSTSEIENEIGCQKENILLLFAEGEARVPPDRAVPLANALGLEAEIFFRAVLETHMPLAEGLDVVYDSARANSRRTVDLNFKVDADFHRLFKIEATAMGVSMKELPEASFKAFRASSV